MKLPFRTYLLIFILAVIPLSAVSQELPSIKMAEEVKTGSFPNGLSYYIVANNTSKGYANFALVQKGAGNQDVIRENLSTLPNFKKVSPYSFEASKGVGYKKEGYVKYTGGSSVFSFEDVPTFDSAALDSTIILIFDIVRGYGGEQAIIVGGDIDPVRIKDRFYLLSLTVGPRDGQSPVQNYEWNPSDKLRVIHRTSATRNLSSVTVSYASARIPVEYMKTPQPLVLSMFATEMENIIRKRVESAFSRADIPLAGVEFSYQDSSKGDSDETYNIGVKVDEKDIEAAASLLASILSDMDSNGVSAAEFSNAKTEFLAEAAKTSSKALSNSEYVNACVSSYLYGSPVLSRSASYDFFKGRRIPLERDLAMFNRFISALFDKDRNVTLICESPSVSLDKDRLSAAFNEAWLQPSVYAGEVSQPKDSLSLAYPGRKKVKLKAEVSDSVTGGKLWTFSNGMKVLFRKTDDENVHYSWLLKGGYSDVPDIKSGESAFVEDMMGLSKVAGMTAMDFSNLLESNGISMDCSMSLTDMRIEGTTVQGKVEFLLRSLLSLASMRETDPEAFAYYRKCEDLRQEDLRISPEGIYAVMDSVMCPDFYYPLTKNMDSLSDGLPAKAERYFSSQFRKSGDGVLYIDGNLDESALKKLLCRYLGSFHTEDRYSLRPKVPYQLRSGWSTYTVDRELSYVGDGSSSTSMAIAVLKPFTMKSWCTFRIAIEALRRQLVVEMAPLGQYIDVETQVQLFPKERLAVFISARPCSMEGLPMDVEPADPYTTLSAIRDAVTAVSIHGVSESDLKGYKASLLHEIEDEMKNPEYLMAAYLRRVSEGKDMVTNYKGYLSSVSVKDVAELLRDFEDAGKVEYIIK